MSCPCPSCNNADAEVCPICDEIECTACGLECACGDPFEWSSEEEKEDPGQDAEENPFGLDEKTVEVYQQTVEDSINAPTDSGAKCDALTPNAAEQKLDNQVVKVEVIEKMDWSYGGDTETYAQNDIKFFINIVEDSDPFLRIELKEKQQDKIHWHVYEDSKDCLKYDGSEGRNTNFKDENEKPYPEKLGVATNPIASLSKITANRYGFRSWCEGQQPKVESRHKLTVWQKVYCRVFAYEEADENAIQSAIDAVREILQEVCIDLDVIGDLYDLEDARLVLLGADTDGLPTRIVSQVKKLEPKITEDNTLALVFVGKFGEPATKGQWAEQVDHGGETIETKIEFTDKNGKVILNREKEIIVNAFLSYDQGAKTPVVQLDEIDYKHIPADIPNMVDAVQVNWPYQEWLKTLPENNDVHGTKLDSVFIQVVGEGIGVSTLGINQGTTPMVMCQTLGREKSWIQANLAHEIGHALGLTLRHAANWYEKDGPHCKSGTPRYGVPHDWDEKQLQKFEKEGCIMFQELVWNKLKGKHILPKNYCPECKIALRKFTHSAIEKWKWTE